MISNGGTRGNLSYVRQILQLWTQRRGVTAELTPVEIRAEATVIPLVDSDHATVTELVHAKAAVHTLETVEATVDFAEVF